MEAQKRKYKKHKQGFKITIGYYLRKENSNINKLLKLEQPVSSKHFPLYIKVFFLGNSVKLRSRLELSLTENEFEAIATNPKIQEFMEREQNSIERSIELLKPDTIDNFSISQWTNYYSNGCQSIYECISIVIMQKLRDKLLNKYNVSNHPKPLRIGTQTLDQLMFLAALNIPQAQELCNQYSPLFKLPELNQILKSEFDLKHDLSFWDWKLGYFQMYFSKLKIDSTTSLLPLINTLLAEFEANHLTDKSPYDII